MAKKFINLNKDCQSPYNAVATFEKLLTEKKFE